MKLLNLGCGYPRIPGNEWVNLDNLHAHLAPGRPERENLDAERNYVNFDVSSGELPFVDSSFDGVLASHFFEHFDAQESIRIMRDVLRILRRGAPLFVSVPNTTYFRQVYDDDRNENWVRLFGVSDPGNPIPKFFTCALWFEQHKALMTPETLWCYFVHAGFHVHQEPIQEGVVRQYFQPHLNRRQFSVEMCGFKP